MVEGVGLLHRQAVHVGAQPDDAAAGVGAAPDDADDPGAADALRRLRDAGTGVVLLSNSGKRAARNAVYRRTTVGLGDVLRMFR